MIGPFRGQYDFLSNFYLTPVKYNGIIYPSSEHAFQAAKTTDMSVRKTIAALNFPGEARAVGRGVILREDWNNIRLVIMTKIIREKFSSNKALKIKLLNTGGHELVEVNTWGDTFWGVCNNVGENHLGKILMKIRKEFQQEIKERLG